MKKINRYLVYNEENRINGNIAAEFVSLAYNETHVREMAEEQGIDLDGYTIECTNSDVRDELHRPYAPYFRTEF